MDVTTRQGFDFGNYGLRFRRLFFWQSRRSDYRAVQAFPRQEANFIAAIKRLSLAFREIFSIQSNRTGCLNGAWRQWTK